MKTRILFLIVVSVLVWGAWTSLKKTGAEGARGATPQPLIAGVPAPSRTAGALESPSVPMPSQNMRETENRGPSFDEKVSRVRTLDELDRAYRNLKEPELRRVLQASASRIQDKDFYAKANRGSLTEDEKIELIFELRRQGVLHHLLAKAGLERLKRKFR